jgi:hypothetical protein
MYGRLECLQYAHEHGCPWNARVMEMAAASGYLECVVYAREKGCPYDRWRLFSDGVVTDTRCLDYMHRVF